jgi:hypothetical protein
MKMITTFAVATALLVLAACSTEDTAPAAEEVVAAEAAPVAAEAAPVADEAAPADKPADSVVEAAN